MSTEEDYDDYDGGDTKGHSPKSPKSSNQLNVNLVNNSTDVQEFVKRNLRNILPNLLALERHTETAVRLLRPYIALGTEYFEQVKSVLEPYGVKEIATCMTGFAMMFFGGFFITTVSVWEAIVQGGLDDLKKNVKLLSNEVRAFRAANEADDAVDADGDGVVDVLQISPEKYAVRKFLLALRATNPEILSQSLHDVYTIFIAVLATLRLQFARTLSLGASLGDQIHQVAQKFVSPQVKLMLPDDYDKWVDPVESYVCRFIGVAIAFQIQRILSTFHTAVKGARVFTRGLTELSQRNGYGYLTEGYLDEALSAVLAVSGIYLQLFAWSTMPIVIKLLFFPAFAMESILSLLLSAALSLTPNVAPDVATATAGSWF